MPELTPRFDPESFVDTDDVKDGKKKKKRKSIAGLGVLAATPDIKTPNTPKPERPKITLDALFGVETSLDKATNTYASKTETARKTRIAESLSDDDTTTAAHSPELTASQPSNDQAETTAIGRAPEVYELKPNELGGGEFIINLRDNPRPSHETVPAEANAEVTVAEAAEQTELEPTAEAEPAEPAAPEAAIDTTPEPFEATQVANAPVPPVKPTVNAWRRPGRRTAGSSASPASVSTTPFTPTPLPGGSGRPPGGGGGNLPPFNPNLPHFQPAGPNTPPTSSGAASPNMLRQIDDAEQDGRTRGRREGLFAGLLVGGGVEHIRHKRRERRMDKKLAATEKKHAKTLEDLHWDGVREKVAEKARANATRPERSTPRASRFEAAAAVQGRPGGGEQLRGQQPEAQPALSKQDKAEEVRRQLAAELQANTEQLKVPEGHRVEQSAWHTVEVDERGRPVEDSVINYGHEYYKERSRESAPVDQSQFKNITGSVALTAAALADDVPADSDSSPSSEAQMRANHEKSHLSMTKRATQALTTPPDSVVGIVPWVIVLLVIVIALLIAL